MSFRRSFAFLIGCALGALALASRAQDAAEVSAVSGTVIVQRADGSVASLALRSTVRPGDVVTTQPNSSARLTFTDKGELTVAGNSQVRIDAYSFSAIAPERDSLLMSLLKGGMRSVTGLIGRRGSLDAYRLKTPAATIGIRGTDYFARLCLEDCTGEVAKTPPVVSAIGADIVARVALLRGDAVARDKLGAVRSLIRGSALYEGDLVETRAQSYAVLAFRDESVVTLQPGAQFEIERFQYRLAKPEQGISVMRLLRGGMRALTGVLARRNPKNYAIRTAVATIGIRGTGFDAWCSGPCESSPGGAAGGTPAMAAAGAGPAPDETVSGLYVSTWEGEVEVINPAGALIVRAGQTVLVAAPTRPPEYLPEMPPLLRDAPGPRPDGIKIEREQLFGVSKESPTDLGLYVLVKEGSVALAQEDKTLVLERGESAFASLDQVQLFRLESAPIFLERDRALSATSDGGLMCTF